MGHTCINICNLRQPMVNIRKYSFSEIEWGGGGGWERTFKCGGIGEEIGGCVQSAQIGLGGFSAM